MSSRKIEMQWTCSACGQDNLGRHTVCQRCGDPKDKNEPYRMPGDTASAATVTDPKLLRMANAGANWRCAYCGSDQRRLDGECAQCGAGQSTGRSVIGESPPVPPAYPAPGNVSRRAQPRARSWIPWIVGAIGLGASLLLGCVVLAAIGANHRQDAYPAALAAQPAPPPRIVEGVVSRLSWQHVVHVERKRLVDHEGFAEAQPADALEVRSAGERVHHHDRVQDGMETETYSERVPYQDTETYSEQERCGEDCTDNPEHCSEHCTPDNNGFATCTTTCTGGGRSCSPRYCSVTRTRSVTRYRDEPRTRQVPRYREVPRNAPWFHWRVWEWGHDRDVAHQGSTEPPTWPAEEELQPPSPLGAGEEERRTTSASYRAFIVFDGTREHEETLRSADDLTRYAAGTRWQLEVQHYGATRVLGPVTSADLADAGTD